MAEMERKNLQVLAAFASALRGMKHGNQQDAVNAALLMFFCAEPDQRSRFVSAFRGLRDDVLKAMWDDNGIVTLDSGGHDRWGVPTDTVLRELQKNMWSGLSKEANRVTIPELSEEVPEPSEKDIAESVRRLEKGLAEVNKALSKKRAAKQPKRKSK